MTHNDARPLLPFVEVMLTQVCNLSCTGCSNYSDLTHDSYVQWGQGQAWFAAWSARLRFSDIGLMGGEPLINPEWQQWVIGIREMFPEAQIRFSTNGLLLAKHPDILDFFQDIGNLVFKITVHVDHRPLENWIAECFERYDWTPVEEYGINRWVTKSNVRLQINRPKTFLRPFKGNYESMSPWMSDPEKAFAQCIQKTCPLLYKGKIYKCSTSALLADTLSRFDYPNRQAWAPFMSNGISSDDPSSDILRFVQGFGKPEPMCSQCPDSSVSVHSHRDTVSFKGKKFINQSLLQN